MYRRPVCLDRAAGCTYPAGQACGAAIRRGAADETLLRRPIIVTSTKILPVIICGGAGSRLWPLSRRAEPKQFAALTGDSSLFQQTLQRFGGDDFLPAAVITNASHADVVRAQAEALGLPLGPVVLEPMGRNTAACGVVSALLGQRDSHAGAVLMAPADHHIERPDDFVAAIQRARPLSDDGLMVTFGITPTGPHTGFGYIEGGESVGSGRRVVQFHEKPTRDRAERYVASGDFLWNAGIFLFEPDAMLGEFSQHAPDVLDAVRAAASNGGDTIALDGQAFASVPDISFDYAIAERTQRAAVVEADMGWSDIGSYSALFELRARLGVPDMPDGSVVAAGDNVFIDSDDPALTVTVAGLDDVGVIIRAGRVMVVNLKADQAVKPVVQALPDDLR